MVSLLSHGYCRSDEISSRLAAAMSELQRAKNAAAEKEATLLSLKAKVEELGKKVNPNTKELAEAQADVRAKRKEVEEAKLRVAEASRRFADLQKQAEMEHRKADAALREAEQKEAGNFYPWPFPPMVQIILWCVKRHHGHCSCRDMKEPCLSQVTLQKAMMLYAIIMMYNIHCYNDT